MTTGGMQGSYKALFFAPPYENVRAIPAVLFLVYLLSGLLIPLSLFLF